MTNLPGEFLHFPILVNTAVIHDVHVLKKIFFRDKKRANTGRGAGQILTQHPLPAKI